MSRALRALSSTYVERRQKLAEGAALSGAGKRAAFALFYGPLHYLLLDAHRRTAAGRDRERRDDRSISAAARARRVRRGRACRPARRGDREGAPRWSASIGIRGRSREAAATYRAFGIPATVRQGDIASVALPKGPASILAAFTMNELADAERDALLARLVERAGRGDRVLIVEPLAGFVARWWNRWRDTFEAAGGRADEWRLRTRAAADRRQARSRRRPQSPRDHRTIAVAVSGRRRPRPARAAAAQALRYATAPTRAAAPAASS